MERARRLPDRPRSLQGKIAADDLNDVIGSVDLINEFRRELRHAGRRALPGACGKQRRELLIAV